MHRLYIHSIILIHYIKQATNRWNIGYTVSICSDDGIDALVSRIKSKINYYTSEDRGIVFIPAVNLFVQVKGMLSISSISCVTYSGQQEDTENVANFLHGRMAK